MTVSEIDGVSSAEIGHQHPSPKSDDFKATTDRIQKGCIGYQTLIKIRIAERLEEEDAG